MAKRLTDSNKQRDPFRRRLPVPYKLFWDFLCDECDHAGIWEVDMELANMLMFSREDEYTVTRDIAFMLFNENKVRVMEIDNGRRWYIPGFILFQYNLERVEDLNPSNRVHLSVINRLKQKKLWKKKLKAPKLAKDSIPTVELPAVVKALRTLMSPTQGAKDKEKEKEKEKDKEKEIIIGKKPTTPKPTPEPMGRDAALDTLCQIVEDKLKMVVKNKKELSTLIKLHGAIVIGQAIGRMGQYWEAVKEHKYKKFVFAKRWNKMAENIEVFLTEDALEDRLAMLEEKNNPQQKKPTGGAMDVISPEKIMTEKDMLKDRIAQSEDYIKFLKEEGDEEGSLPEAKKQLKQWKEELAGMK